jgi:hypothetical protein
MEVTGSIGSVEGAAANVSDPFQVTNCASLKFAPKFAVSTAGFAAQLPPYSSRSTGPLPLSLYLRNLESSPQLPALALMLAQRIARQSGG